MVYFMLMTLFLVLLIHLCVSTSEDIKSRKG